MTGRNDICPCGSGKKYKKCCIKRQSIKRTNPVIERPAPEPERGQYKHYIKITLEEYNKIYNSLLPVFEQGCDYDEDSIDEDMEMQDTPNMVADLYIREALVYRHHEGECKRFRPEELDIDLDEIEARALGVYFGSKCANVWYDSKGQSPEKRLELFKKVHLEVKSEWESDLDDLLGGRREI